MATFVNTGSRARIGLMAVHSSPVIEEEFWAMAPHGVTIHTTLMYLPRATVDGLDRLARDPELERCVELLTGAPLSAVIFGGTSASFLHGLGWDREMIRRLEPHARGVPVTTTSTASLQALRAVHAKRIAIATPYIDAVNERAVRFFEDNGFDVLRLKGLGLDDDLAMGRVPLERMAELVREANHPDADTVFVPCTGWYTVAAIDALEQELGKPVVSANQASFWQCLRIAGIDDDLPGFGSLFRHAARPAA